MTSVCWVGSPAHRRGPRTRPVTSARWPGNTRTRGRLKRTTAAGDSAVGRDFEVTTRALYGVWGLLKLREPDIGTALAGQLVGGERIANVRVRVRSRWSDVLISGLTLGLIVPRAVTYEGTVVGP